jgi:dTDP-4-dehydrorhamnose reductase
MEAFVRGHAPDVLYHLAIASQSTGRGPNESWQVNYEWSSELAWITRSLGVRRVFASTATVFSDRR